MISFFLRFGLLSDYNEILRLAILPCQQLSDRSLLLRMVSGLPIYRSFHVYILIVVNIVKFEVK